MKSIVITGSTNGIGLGLVDAFLARDCAVTISGHSQMNLDRALWLNITSSQLATLALSDSTVSCYNAFNTSYIPGLVDPLNDAAIGRL